MLYWCSLLDFAFGFIMVKKFSTKTDPHYTKEKLKYKNPICSREHIIAFMKSINKPITHDSMIQQLIQSERDIFPLKNRIKAVMRDGQIMQDREKKYILVETLQLAKGTIIYDKDSGYQIVLENNQVLKMMPKYHNMVFEGDMALINIAKNKKITAKYASLVEVVSRKFTKVTGVVTTENGITFLNTLIKQFTVDVIITEGDVPYAPGDYVIAEITHYPDANVSHCNAKVVTNMGDEKTNGIEVQVALNTYDLPHTWDDDVFNQVLQLPTKIIKVIYKMS